MEEIPNSKFSPLVNFLKEIECPAFKTLLVGNYGSYVNKKGAAEMHQTTSNTLVEVCPNTTVDESTDISNMKRLITYMRYIDDDKKIMDGRADTGRNCKALPFSCS